MAKGDHTVRIQAKMWERIVEAAEETGAQPVSLIHILLHQGLTASIGKPAKLSKRKKQEESISRMKILLYKGDMEWEWEEDPDEAERMYKYFLFVARRMRNEEMMVEHLKYVYKPVDHVLDEEEEDTARGEAENLKICLDNYEAELEIHSGHVPGWNYKIDTEGIQ